MTTQSPLCARSPMYRWLRRWQFGLNVLLAVASLHMWAFVSWRAVYFLLLLPVATIPFSYARLRFHAQLERVLPDGARPALWSVTLAGMACDGIMLAQLLVARAGSPVPFLHAPVVSWIGAIWFSTFGLLFLVYGLLAVAQRGRQLLRSARRLTRTAAPIRSAPVFSPARRQFLQQLGAVGAGTPLVFSLSSVTLTYDFRVEEREITLPQWPRRLDGLRVAHLSDIHVGGAMDHRHLARIAALTTRARPDMVLHTGDFLTHRSGDFDRPLYTALAQIQAPYGQWACLGNHDFDNPERLVRRLRLAGVTTLRNALATLTIDGQPLQIAGADFVFRQTDRERVYQPVVRSWGDRLGIPRLLLIHDPRAFADLPDGCADLVLSGHTHGGHVGLQLGRDHALTVVGLLGIPDQGIFFRKDLRMYVTRCVGFYGYPMRLGIPPEIAILTLRSPTPPPSIAPDMSATIAEPDGTI